MRKSHTKSRRGCIQCKSRHTKCNEAHPRCGNCTRLDIACSFTVQQQRPITPSSLGSPAPNHIAQVPGQTSTAAVLDVSSLELLHNFLRGEGFNLLSGEKEKVFRDGYVQTGYEVPYVLHSILAVSAIEIASRAPVRRAEMLSKGAEHWTKSLEMATPHMSQITQEHALPLFVVSGMTSIYAHAEASMRLEGHHSVSHGAEPIDELVKCIRLSRGISTVIAPQFEYLKDSWAAPIFNLPPDGRKFTEEEDLETSFTAYSDIKRLITQQCPREEDSMKIAKAFEDVLTYLTVNLRLSHKYTEDFVLIQMWQTGCPDVLLDLMTQRAPIALIILAYYAALMSTRPQLWWFYSWRSTLLRSIEEELAPRYAGLIEQAKDIVQRINEQPSA